MRSIAARTWTAVAALGLAGVWGAALVGWPQQALAQQAYPHQPIRFYVGNVPGSSSDTIGRVYAGALSPLLGQQVVVFNQPGAGGTLAAEVVARAAPDGYTLMVTSTQAHAISPHLYPKAKYRPLEDYVPVTMLARTENVLIVPPQQPFRTVAEIVAFGKANPGKLTMANAGPGSQSHLAGAAFTKLAGIDVLHVPYKGAASVTAVLGNQNELSLTPMPAAASQIASGRLIAVAVGGAMRTPVLPEVPTIAESGYPGFNSSGWTGLVMPKGTQPAAIDTLREAIAKVAADPAVRTAVERAGAEVWLTSPEAMWAFVADDLKRYGEAVQITGVKAE